MRSYHDFYPHGDSANCAVFHNPRSAWFDWIALGALAGTILAIVVEVVR